MPTPLAKPNVAARYSRADFACAAFLTVSGSDISSRTCGLITAVGFGARQRLGKRQRRLAIREQFYISSDSDSRECPGTMESTWGTSFLAILAYRRLLQENMWSRQGRFIFRCLDWQCCPRALIRTANVTKGKLGQTWAAHSQTVLASCEPLCTANLTGENQAVSANASEGDLL